MTVEAVFLGLLAFLAGWGLSVQAGVSLELARGIGSPLTAITISFLIGTILFTLATLLTHQPLPTAQTVKILPPYVWIGGGMLGAFFLFSVLFLAPRLGIAVVFSTAIAGQLIAALIFDQYGFLGNLVREATTGRIVGVAVMLAGVLMIRFL